MWEASHRFGTEFVVPDLYVVYDAPHLTLSMAVEVEVKNSTKVFLQKVRKYIRFSTSGTWRQSLGTFPLVVVVTYKAKRAEMLWRAAESINVPKEVRFVFASIEHVKRDPLGTVWRVSGREGHHTLMTLGVDELVLIEALAAQKHGESLDEAARHALPTALTPDYQHLLTKLAEERLVTVELVPHSGLLMLADVTPKGMRLIEDRLPHH